MLEYFTIKKVKKHRAEKAERERLEKEKSEQEAAKAKEDTDVVAAASAPTTTNSKGKVEDAPIIISEPRGEAPTPTPVLEEEDGRFLERLASSSTAVTPGDGQDDETPPPLPPRVKTPVIEWDSDASSIAGGSGEKNGAQIKKEGKGKDNGPELKVSTVKVLSSYRPQACSVPKMHRRTVVGGR